MPDFIIGDSRPYEVVLLINEETFPIDPSCTVKAAIVSFDKKTALTSDPITLSSTTPGSDWTDSKVVVKFPRESTKSIIVVGKAYIEVQVTIDTDDWTWHIPITLIPGTI